MALVVPALLAFVFGWFAFRSRVTGVYLSIITQAMSFVRDLADTYVVMDRGEVVMSGDGTSMDESQVRQHLAV